ncbi:MAG: hypothetical protein M0Q12_00880 [Synergistaceae bacterium]|nr:hypothetical protein [Synergistaceae bacterium]
MEEKLLNYTTQVAAEKSIGEIQKKLVAHGAREILIKYDGGTGEPAALLFIIPLKKEDKEGVPFRLPANIKQVEQKLLNMRARPWNADRGMVHAQALRVGWRIVKDWVEAQLAIIDTEMVTLREVFLPYMMMDEQHTVYDIMESKGYFLGQGNKT